MFLTKRNLWNLLIIKNFYLILILPLKQNWPNNRWWEIYLKSREVVLAWPYKDCVLEGGQKKEDEKREEIFYNEILAPDEIDRLLEPKVLTNFKRIDVKGEHTLDGFKRDAEVNKKRGLPKDTITDNLIIKGNNLLVLHSLLKEFRGKVKLIYIDPPYNTGNDSFNYMIILTILHGSLYEK